MFTKVNDETWFIERNNFWPGIATSLRIEEILEDVQSDFQHVVVAKSSDWGNVLFLDGVIQITERDECSYQEMITNIPLFSHPNPKRVCIVGGGDGGVLREVCKHKTVEEIYMCEIDGKVIELSKKYLPSIASAYDDPRLTLIVDDAFKFIPTKENYFDVIIVDSSDPDGPAAALFQKPFYTSLHKALREKGTICTQAESLWLHLDFITSIIPTLKEVWDSVRYSYISVPTYPGGGIGFFVCGKGLEIKGEPVREIPEDIEDNCNFYNKDTHEGAFKLPTFAQRKLREQL